MDEWGFAAELQHLRIRSAAVMALALGMLVSSARGVESGQLEAVPDRITYNAGEVVGIRLQFPNSGWQGSVRAFGSIRYEAEPETQSRTPAWSGVFYTGLRPPAGYLPLWHIPLGAATGRYDIDLQLVEVASDRVLARETNAASFAVHRKLLRIDRIELDKEIYSSGNPVAVSISLRNLSARALTGLRVEFSDRYWPWIAGPAEQAKASIVVLTPSAGIPAGGSYNIHRAAVATVPEVKQPGTHQYGVVVWDHARKQALDIAFSRLVFVHPPGVSSPRPYPGQYVYSDLASVNTKSYRHFYAPGKDSAAIVFDHEHTMFTPGASATVALQVTDPGPEAWRGAAIEARLLGSDGKELASKRLAEAVDLQPGGAPLKESVELQLPNEPGLYRVQVRVTGAAGGQVLADNSLELAVNPLPASLLIFCAHEDDEGSWDGMIRAAVENRVPLHFVYFTSGDAGACDRYYEHSCGAEEALNFGYVRMQETVAVLGHLGVQAGDILFLGLPDGGSGEIWYHHLMARDPYLAPLLASDHSPYERMAVPNLPYAREAVVDAAAKLIQRFTPAAIVTAHPPAEGHIDHIVANFFAVKALQDLSRKGTAPPGVKVLADRIYVPKEHPATPYRYESHTFYVSGEAAALAQESGWFYQSQGGNRAEGNLRDFDQLSREQTYREVLNWKEFEGWNEREPGPSTQP